MLRRFAPTIWAPLALTTLAGAQSAVDFLYSNITDSTSTTVPREYSDAIVVWNRGGGTPVQRPLAQETHTTSSGASTRTGSVRKMKVRSILGFPNVVWHDIIADATVADAILDRLIHNAYRIELQGESLRRRQAPDAASGSKPSEKTE